MSTWFEQGRQHVLTGVGEPTGDYSHLISVINLMFFSGGILVATEGLSNEDRHEFYKGMTEASKQLGVIERRNV